jgi:hypothetical protein
MSVIVHPADSVEESMLSPLRAAAFLTAALLVLPLTGCGCCDDHDHEGNVFVANQTDTTTPEDANTFELAPFGVPFSGNLLGAPLPAGNTHFVGAFQEDYYDARAEMALGDLVEWFDIFVGADQDSFFDIF